MTRWPPAWTWLIAVPALLGGCKKTDQRYTTTVEVLQIRRFGSQDAKGGSMLDVELKYADCPADTHKVLRGDKAFGACAAQFKAGDKLPAEVVLSYSSERGLYRSEVVRVGTCPIQIDPKDEANYELVQTCRDLKASGLVVGVRCERRRSPELVAKCPWLRRR